ncbi:hypothetical protein BC567DRAFT_213685 [Phyllosticta citribraziliensis]
MTLLPPCDQELERKLTENAQLNRESFQKLDAKFKRRKRSDDESDQGPILNPKAQQRWDSMVERMEAEAQKEARGETASDVVDLETMEIIEDHGHLHGLPDHEEDVERAENYWEELSDGGDRPERQQHQRRAATRGLRKTQSYSDLRAQGMSFSDIAKRFPGRTVQSIIARHNYVLKRQEERQSRTVWIPDDNALLCSLRAGGMAFSEIANRLRRSTAQVITQYHRLKGKREGRLS